jgi:hypothetical protein
MSAVRVYFTAVRPPTPEADVDETDALLQRLGNLKFDVKKCTPLPLHARAPVTKMYVEPEIWEDYFQSSDKRLLFEKEWRACKRFMQVAKTQALEMGSATHDSLELADGLVPEPVLRAANEACHNLHAAYTAALPLLKKNNGAAEAEPMLSHSTAVVFAFHANLGRSSTLLANINVALRVVNAAMACVRTADEYGPDGTLRLLLAALPGASAEHKESLAFVRERLPAAVDALRDAAMECLELTEECDTD